MEKKKNIVIEIYAEIDPSIPEEKIGEEVQPLLEEIMLTISDFEEYECKGFTVRSASDIEMSRSTMKSPICIIDSKDLQSNFEDRFLVEDYKYYVIRIPIEGDESHKKRFDLIEEAIKKTGTDDSVERLNFYFVFDTGLSTNEFINFSHALLLNTSQEVKRFAVNKGITFCQWLNKKDRKIILYEINREEEWGGYSP